MRMTIWLKIELFKIRVESAADLTYVFADGIQRRPVRRHISWQSAANRIDAERKQPIKTRIDALHSEDAAVQKIPIKRLQMSDIKNDAVTLGDGPVIQRIGTHHSEEGVTAASRVQDPFDQVMGNEITRNFFTLWRSKHSDAPNADAMKCGQ